MHLKASAPEVGLVLSVSWVPPGGPEVPCKEVCVPLSVLHSNKWLCPL
jgi:hypothetical protein